MADVSHIITLGIGTPGAIKQFLTFGLGIGTTTDAQYITVDTIGLTTSTADTISLSPSTVTTAGLTVSVADGVTLDGGA